MNFRLTQDNWKSGEGPRFRAAKSRPFTRRSTASSPRRVVQKLGEMACWVSCSQRNTGMDGSVLTCCLVGEELSCACASTSMSYLATRSYAPQSLVQRIEEQKKYLPTLPAAPAGRHRHDRAQRPVGRALDTDLRGTAEQRYIVNGSKTYITNARG